MLNRSAFGIVQLIIIKAARTSPNNLISAFSSQKLPHFDPYFGRRPCLCSITTRSVITSRNKSLRLMSPSVTDDASSRHGGLKRLVLIGGGHAHVQVIKALNDRSRPENVHVTLIDLQSNAFYSGMVPGCVSKLYSLDQVKINLEALAKWAGTEFVCGEVVAMTLPSRHEVSNQQKLVHVKVYDESNCNGIDCVKHIPFDVISIDIGSTSRDFNTVPGASEFCISTRPISALVRRIEMEESLLQKNLHSNNDVSNYETKVVVVGGGAAGIELSLAMRARWELLHAMSDDKNALLAKSRLSITLLDSKKELMPGESVACRTALNRVMDKYRIEVHHNVSVNEVTSTDILISGSNDSIHTNAIPYTHCIWATGAEAHGLSWKLNNQSNLSVNTERGWILVNKYLQSTSHPYVFAAGDCSEIVSQRSPPKAGVYAVRAGPILIQNLMISLLSIDAADNTTELVEYIPQNDFLKLMMCGDGTALGFRFGLPMYGKWVWQLKNNIDTMFMDLFNVDKLSGINRTIGRGTPKEPNTLQYDEQAERPALLNPRDAAKLLLRTDDAVDYHIAWNVLRGMISSDDYKEEVLQHIPVECFNLERSNKFNISTNL